MFADSFFQNTNDFAALFKCVNFIQCSKAFHHFCVRQINYRDHTMGLFTILLKSPIFIWAVILADIE